MSMFCYQCEQTAKGTGCTAVGVCGKDETTAKLQDLLVYATKGISTYAHEARSLYGASEPEIDEFVVEALFTTITNVNFDPGDLMVWLDNSLVMLEKAKSMYENAARKAGDTPEAFDDPATFVPADGIDGRLAQATEIGVESRKEELGEERAGVIELITYGLKGAAAYADHARILGIHEDTIDADFHRLMAYVAYPDHPLDDLLAKALETGELNMRVMALLDEAHTSRFGHPEPTSVRVTPVAGKSIVVSGHDLLDLEELLKQTEGKGINIYTHGEMLPAHGYPELKKYPHLVGNYGGAWQDQKKEFSEFPGAILMTTNCIQKPDESYMDRIYTCGLVQWPGVKHITDRDFSEVIEAALAAPGFTEDAEDHQIMVGFAHNAVMSVADKVVDAVKGGKIKHFFLVGGCDGAKSGRNYYTEFAKAVPDDSVILTLACGKYRFNKLDFGDIEGIPRLLDIGQCNDAYSAVRIASALSEAFGVGLNELPLSIICSWYEQKAVAILLTLLYLGMENIKLGPSLPAFVTQPVLDVLVEKFKIAPISSPEEDLQACLTTGATA